MRETVFASEVTIKPSAHVLRTAALGLTPQWQEPQTETERKLAHIWQRTLGKGSIGVSDDFFDLGGDSLAATVLAVEIEATFGMPFQLSDIVEFSTVAKQALKIDRPASSAKTRLPSCLIVARAAGSRLPVFVVHGAWGFNFFKRAFIEEVGQDRPIYLFQAPGIDGHTSPLTSVEEIARLYVEAMQVVQPNGPYNIVSMCAGSFIALEMSHLVEVADGTVARLILIDPHPEPDEPSPDGPHSAGRNNLRINARLKAVAKFFVESVINISSNGHRGQPLRSQRLREKIRMGREINTDWIENSTDVPEAMLRSVRQLRKALRKCRPHPFSGKGVMLLTSERQNQVLESGSFWRTHLDGIDYQVCDWDHRSLFSVHLLETARFVRNALEMPFDPRLMPGALIGQI